MRFYLAMTPPASEQLPLLAKEFTLTRVQRIGLVEVMLVLRVALLDHQIFIVQNQVGSFVEL